MSLWPVLVDCAGNGMWQAVVLMITADPPSQGTCFGCGAFGCGALAFVLSNGFQFVMA